MTTDDRDPMEASIDAVARQMVAVRDEEEFATRIAAALPQRRARFFWLIPQLGAAAAIAIAVVVWLTRATPAPPEATIAMVPLRAAIDAVEPLRPVEPVEPAEPVRPVEPLEPATNSVEPVERFDHERSLPPAESPVALAMSDLAPRELPSLGALTLAPLEIGELPLTGESFPPREF